MTATIIAILGSPAVQTALLGLIGGAWAWFRGTEWWQAQTARATGTARSKALLALEAGVDLAYRTYVQQIKLASADGTLTPDEQAEARRISKEAALAFAKQNGVDLIVTLGAESLDVWIAKIVKNLKGPGNLPADARDVLEGAGL